MILSLSRINGAWTVYRKGRALISFLSLYDALECAFGCLRRTLKED